jgi:hypothetical protein
MWSLIFLNCVLVGERPVKYNDVKQLCRVCADNLVYEKITGSW